MISFTRSEIVELIKHVQSSGGDDEQLKALEHASGNPNVWIIFTNLELEGMSPANIFDMFFAQSRP